VTALLAGCRGRSRQGTREGSRPSKRSSALEERACRRIALTELREALGGSARCADQAKKTYRFPCVPQGKTHSFLGIEFRQLRLASKAHVAWLVVGARAATTG
jgi:hypothetical protein